MYRFFLKKSSDEELGFNRGNKFNKLTQVLLILLTKIIKNKFIFIF
jgi:hypothetical protein